MKIGKNTPAIVTGGASGLGEACARAFRERGAPVAILDLHKERGEEVAAEIGAMFIETDVASDASVEAALEQAAAAHGVARIVVSCAGIAPAMKTAGSKGPHDMGLFEKVVGVNLVGTMRVMAFAAQAMREAEPLDEDGCRGVVINTASVAAFEGQVGQGAYAASKGGVAALTLPAARDLMRDGIRVNAIAPGIFATPMLMAMPDDVQQSLAEQVPFPQRLGTPEEYAALACYIAEAGYLNGAVIRLDGAIRMGPR
ncbi:MAG TPA: SDR family oxidoreductase [Thermohalobaculum sp.]|nr:SDR family oxidoreductase [Thermohalobaculum sp.]